MAPRSVFVMEGSRIGVPLYTRSPAPSSLVANGHHERRIAAQGDNNFDAPPVGV